MDITNIPFANIIAATKQTGKLVMEELEGGVDIESKDDKSPVTEADKVAHRNIVSFLAEFTPDIPVLSEEGKERDRRTASNSKVKWITDPLDGTRTAIQYAKGNKDRDSFGIHLALVVDGEPVLGVAHFPAMEKGQGVTYFTSNDGKTAFKQVADGPPKKLQASKRPMKGALRAAVHFKEERRPDEIADREYQPVAGVGGQRLCLVAEGQADVADMNDIPEEYRETHGYKQWDLAAGQAILRAAGGELVTAEHGMPVNYTSPDPMVPGSYGGSVDMLRLLDLGQLPPKGRELR